MSQTSQDHLIETSIHGRYVVQGPLHGAPLLLGFHGYAENADVQLARMLQIPGAEAWLCCSVQALHPFYGKSGAVVASWMTRANREAAIAANIRYVEKVIDTVRAQYQTKRPTVLIGFSQGGPMAYRAAYSRQDLDGVIILGGDMADELLALDLEQLPPVLICRGDADPHISNDIIERDLEALRRGKVDVEYVTFLGGHEWTSAFYSAAGAFLRRRLDSHTV